VLPLLQQRQQLQKQLGRAAPNPFRVEMLPANLYGGDLWRLLLTMEDPLPLLPHGQLERKLMARLYLKQLPKGERVAAQQALKKNRQETLNRWLTTEVAQTRTLMGFQKPSGGGLGRSSLMAAFGSSETPETFKTPETSGAPRAYGPRSPGGTAGKSKALLEKTFEG